MTTPTRLERNLPGILDDLSAAPTSEYLDDVFARTARMRQRPAWTFPERWIPMAEITRPRAFGFAPPLRTIAVALIVIALIVAAAALYVGSQQGRLPAPFGPARNGLISYESAGDIYVGDPVTGASRLVVGGIPNDDHDPGFSSDGTLIAFLRSTDANNVDLYVVRPDGSDVKKVTTSPIPSDSWVNWAPDSRHLGVIRLENGHKRFDILGLDGSQLQLATGMDIDSFGYRPPLAQEILVRAIVDGHPGLFTMKADGTDVRSLVKTTSPADIGEEVNWATYSADGSRIFYQRWFPDSVQLWVMNADGTDQHRFDTQVAPAWSGEAAVSPDGKWIAYWHAFDDGRATQRVSVLRADGTGPLIQTGPELKGTADFGWSPDSSKILMITSDPADSPGSYLLDPAGGPWTKTAWQTASVGDWQRLAP